MAADDVDFAVAAYRQDGLWQLTEIAPELAEDIDDLTDALERWPSEAGVLGLVSVDDEFFVVARVYGSTTRLLLSDVLAVTEYPLASGIAEILDVPDPDDDDEPQPAGDMDILADLGVSAIDLAVLLDDTELFPDEMLLQIATRLGFGSDLEALVE